MRLLVENINLDILKKCREQIGLSHESVEKKIGKIVSIEEGKQKPTFKQLDTLADLYNVPRWVFISEFLPEQYQFNETVLNFRQFTDNRENLFSNYEVRKLTARIEKFRKLIIELREDMQEPVDKFSPPKIEDNASPKTIAKEVISWLKEEKNLDFNQWKEKLEEKNIFVFLTSKYRGWSHIGKDLFRGLAIYHSCLPIIIINDSDIKKTQSLTLFHELGHLLRRESAIDDWDEHPKKVEKWCDELAGNILMPETLFSDDSYNAKDLRGIKKMAKEFNVSNYACLVRLRQLQIIDQTTYLKVEQELKKEYVRMQEKLKESQGGPARNRPQEVIDQYGHIYARALFQAYHNQEISLHKLSQAFDLKRASSVLEVYDKL